MERPIVSKRTYLCTYLTLLVLTLATTLLAYLNLGPFSTIIATAIAAIQASLIAGVFMQALNESVLIRVVAAGGVIWFLIMMTLVITDYTTRGWLPYPGK